MLYVMAGGGTGGHVMPLLAVAEELRRRGEDVLFIGTRKGLEAKLAPAGGFEIEWIDIGGLNRVGWRQTMQTMMQLPGGVAHCRSLLRKRDAAAVLSLGGYVAGPVVLGAALSGVPIIAMEPNAVPGMVTRRMSRLVTKALVNFVETQRYFPPGRSELCGLPVRREFFEIGWEPANGVFHLLITGGSRGSRTLNRAAVQSFPLFARSCKAVRLVVQTGAEEHDRVAAAMEKSGVAGEVHAFIEDMPKAYARANLIVSRAGAGAISEIAAAGRPSLLIPFPYATDDHQRYNAQAMVRAGAAETAEDSKVNGDMLVAVVESLRAAPVRLAAMSQAARGMARPGAASRAADVLEEAARAR